jgi:two-component system response regulator RegA
MKLTPGVHRIVVCEDDDAFRRRLVRGLRDREFVVYEAATAEELLEVAAEYTPQAAVIDLRMPGKGGLWGVQELVKVDPEIEIVVLTGFGSITTALDAVRLGAVNYLTKPTSIEELLSAFEPKQSQWEEPVKIPPLEQVQTEYINRVLAECGGNISRAARALGLHRRSLQRMLQNRDGG